MSVSEQDEDEPFDLLWCERHELAYIKWCSACREDADDRDFDTMRERTLEVRAQRRERRKP